MKRAWVLLISIVLACQSDPIESPEPAAALGRCCAEARSRVETVKDRETAQFQKWCNACRKGDSKASCLSAAKNVLHATQNAFGEYGMPVSCSAMMQSLQESGIH
ncbi:MAG TPA: hypothetical protein PLJ27_00380 [Polyangiaceae bacterium]|nr:hypothetical protein [Polyangiaceae bacterium]HNZ22667.1 hypothetical protein [Polyangiaceae bacterium]HOD21561.1 hypothetical protein [Polyangiaceae bacterium]HOE49289.1 hypothetical protein [Polyangiaceae bacterium]HOH00336.1 hypothetical protein [Polyangiaceae bacterium]